MDHEHVWIAVHEAEHDSAEEVPARRLADGTWELLRTPLYAMGVAAADVVRVVDGPRGSYEIVKRGGNVGIQLYLGDAERNDAAATARAATILDRAIAPLGGRIESSTRGLVACTVPLAPGFAAIQAALADVVEQVDGAEWQYTNVYDLETEELLNWWEE